MDRLLSAREVAAYLGIAYKTAHRLIRSGELPAMRIGGVYRVSSSELERYLDEKRIRTSAHDASEGVPAPSPRDPTGGPTADGAMNEGARAATCGLCRRVVPDGTRPALCGAEGCEQVLCSVCVERGERLCLTHRRTYDEKLAEAQSALAAGGGGVLVSSEEAASLEEQFIGGFREQVMGTGEFPHPLTGEKVRVRPARVMLEEDDELRRMASAGVSVPRFTSGEAHPRNARAIATVGSGKRGFVVAAEFVGHLQAYARDGFDTRVADSSDMRRVTTELASLVKQRGGLPVVAGLVSPTGWTAEVAARASGVGTGQREPSAVVTIVVDSTGALLEKAGSEGAPLRAVDVLFGREAQFARRKRARQHAEEWFVLHDSLSLEMAASDLELPIEVVRDVFNEMASSGGYRFERIRGTGWVLYPCELKGRPESDS